MVHKKKKAVFGMLIAYRGPPYIKAQAKVIRRNYPPVNICKLFIV